MALHNTEMHEAIILRARKTLFPIVKILLSSVNTHAERNQKSDRYASVSQSRTGAKISLRLR
ncbi:hypothetical protein [Trichormus variabilis]|uniref:Uncharacterized protein n=1 Tax=Trichormus variabilis N2B TaxID=2681315 RepID=A0ABR6S610_ANAVA|nr:hypothetical protein [Trichormus variabilis]MBC1301829.1 hypothetical protein [Trichormus variabilis N2B]